MDLAVTGAVAATNEWVSAVRAAGGSVSVIDATSTTDHFSGPVAAARLRDVARRLGRPVPLPGTCTHELAVRADIITADVEAVYIVGWLTTWLPLNGTVGGGGYPGWVAQFFASRRAEVRGAIPLFFYDFNTASWVQCHVLHASVLRDPVRYVWRLCSPAPRPAGRFAGIASHHDMQSAAAVITTLLQPRTDDPATTHP